MRAHQCTCGKRTKSGTAKGEQGTPHGWAVTCGPSTQQVKGVHLRKHVWAMSERSLKGSNRHCACTRQPAFWATQGQAYLSPDDLGKGHVVRDTEPPGYGATGPATPGFGVS